MFSHNFYPMRIYDQVLEIDPTKEFSDENIRIINNLISEKVEFLISPGYGSGFHINDDIQKIIKTKVLESDVHQIIKDLNIEKIPMCYIDENFDYTIDLNRYIDLNEIIDIINDKNHPSYDCIIKYIVDQISYDRFNPLTISSSREYYKMKKYVLYIISIPLICVHCVDIDNYDGRETYELDSDIYFGKIFKEEYNKIHTDQESIKLFSYFKSFYLLLKYVNINQLKICKNRIEDYTSGDLDVKYSKYL